MAFTKTKQRKKKRKKEARNSNTVVGTNEASTQPTENYNTKHKDTYNLKSVSYTLFGGGKAK